MSRPILQLLLGMFFLAWLPIMGDAGSESPFLFQVEEAFSSSDLPDGGEPDPSGPNDRQGAPDTLVPPRGIHHAAPDSDGMRIHQPLSDGRRLADLLAARHATGPPGLWS